MFNTVFRPISLGVLLLMVGTVSALIASEEIKWSQSTLEDSMTKAADDRQTDDDGLLHRLVRVL